MKLIIDIPEDVYKAHKMGDISPWIVNSIFDAVMNGIPLPKGYGVDVLDKIRAEIENINLNEVATKYEDRFYGFQQEVLQIIDKYKAESEDKCSKCEYYINPDYTRCKECGAERSDKE